MYRAAWLGPHAPDGIARMGFADLLKLWRRRTPLIWHARRNDEMIAGLLLRALGWPLKLVFTSAAQRHHKLADALADPADGCRDRHLRTLGVVSQARGDGGDAWRRYRCLCAAGRSRGGVCGSETAGTLRDRLLRPGARAKGHGRLRRGDVPAAAALSRFHRGHRRCGRAGAAGFCQRPEETDRSRRACNRASSSRANSRSRRCSAGTSG